MFSLKTNTVFAGIFLFAFTSNFVLSGAYWKVSTGDFDMALKLQKVHSSSVCFCGWGEGMLTRE